MAAVTATIRRASQESRNRVAKTCPRPAARPGCSSRSVPLPSTAHKRQLGHRTAMPVFTKSRAHALISAATASYNSMLHCYKPASLFSSHSPLITSHCLFNRQPRRLETTVTLTKETPATQINRQLSGTLRSANHNSPITNKTPSNQQWQILEFTVTHTEQTTAPRSNRHYLRCLDLQIQQPQELCRTRAAFEGRLSTLDLQPSPIISNRNNTSFKIAGNSLKINVERNPNRNTNRELRLTPFLRSHTPAPTALTAQHASPTMKMRRHEQNTAPVAAAFRASQNTGRGSRIANH